MLLIANLTALPQNSGRSFLKDSFCFLLCESILTSYIIDGMISTGFRTITIILLAWNFIIKLSMGKCVLVIQHRPLSPLDSSPAHPIYWSGNVKSRGISEPVKMPVIDSK